MAVSGSEKTRLGLYGAARSPYGEFGSKITSGGTLSLRPVGVLSIGTVPGSHPVVLPTKCNTWKTDDDGRTWKAGRDGRTWNIPGKCK